MRKSAKLSEFDKLDTVKIWIAYEKYELHTKNRMSNILSKYDTVKIWIAYEK